MLAHFIRQIQKNSHLLLFPVLSEKSLSIGKLSSSPDSESFQIFPEIQVFQNSVFCLKA